MKTKMRIGVLVSGSGTNLEAITNACNNNEINGEIVLVGADRPLAGGLEKAKKAGIDTFVVDYAQIFAAVQKKPKDFETTHDFLAKTYHLQKKMIPKESSNRFLARLVAERKLLSTLSPLRLDLLVLAGFMRRLTPSFVETFSPETQFPRIMNIHPSILPAFPGTDGYGDSFRFGCKVAGCTVHFVDHDVDTGPIIAQESFHIEEADTLQSVREKGLQIEWKLYPRCIGWYTKGKIQIELIQNKKHVKII